MAMPTEPLGILPSRPARHAAEFGACRAHGFQVVAQPLGVAEPLPLAFVATEHLELRVHHVGDVDIQFGHDQNPHAITVQMRLGMVEINILLR